MISRGNPSLKAQGTLFLKEDSPLDLSEDFNILCEACRTGDLKSCQEKISEGVNINARDSYDYTPLILVSASPLIHHFPVWILSNHRATSYRDR